MTCGCLQKVYGVDVGSTLAVLVVNFAVGEMASLALAMTEGATASEAWQSLSP